MTMDKYKEIAANAAVEKLEDGLVVGLGSGTTSELALAAIGRRLKEGLRIIGIPTSEKIADLARGLDIPLSTLADHPQVDVTIDGADEVQTGTLHLIKGGGGNLLREKIVAVSSARLVIVADESKVVRQLGAHWAVPVEVVPFGWQTTKDRLKRRTETDPVLRLAPGGEAYVTDGGHYILDCFFGPMENPFAVAALLKETVGVVEHGLFLRLASEAFIGGPGGVTRMRWLGPKSNG
jgi:ribose 5-phosphate isomerase A